MRHTGRRESGRISALGLAGIVSVLLVGYIFISSRESLSTVANRFMGALAKHDVDTVSRMTYMPELSQDEIKKRWTKTFDYAKYYRFQWKLVSADQQGPESGAVRLQMRAPFDDPGSYEQGQQFSMIKVNGEWKVDVRSMSREMYPGLPR